MKGNFNMTGINYNKMKALIEQEIKHGKIDDLIQLREFLNAQIKLFQSSVKQTEAEQFDILNLELTEFLTSPTYGLKYFRNDLVNVIQKMKQLKRVVLVFDSVGIGKNILLQEKGIGPRTIVKYERALNKYGYSLDKPLTEEQQEQFKNYQKQLTA